MIKFEMKETQQIQTKKRIRRDHPADQNARIDTCCMFSCCLYLYITKNNKLYGQNNVGIVYMGMGCVTRKEVCNQNDLMQQ